MNVKKKNQRRNQSELFIYKSSRYTNLLDPNKDLIHWNLMSMNTAAIHLFEQNKRKK